MEKVACPCGHSISLISGLNWGEPEIDADKGGLSALHNKENFILTFKCCNMYANKLNMLLLLLILYYSIV